MGEKRRVELEPVEDEGTQVYGAPPPPPPPAPRPRPAAPPPRRERKFTYLTNIPSVDISHTLLEAGIVATGAGATLFILSFALRNVNLAVGQGSTNVDLAAGLGLILLAAGVYVGLAFAAGLMLKSPHYFFLHLGITASALGGALFAFLVILGLIYALMPQFSSLAYALGWLILAMAVGRLSRYYAAPANKVPWSVSLALYLFASYLLVTELASALFAVTPLRTLYNILPLVEDVVLSVVVPPAILMIAFAGIWLIATLFHRMRLDAVASAVVVYALFTAAIAGSVDVLSKWLGHSGLLLIAYLLLMALVLATLAKLYAAVKRVLRK